MSTKGQLRFPSRSLKFLRSCEQARALVFDCKSNVRGGEGGGAEEDGLAVGGGPTAPEATGAGEAGVALLLSTSSPFARGKTVPFFVGRFGGRQLTRRTQHVSGSLFSSWFVRLLGGFSEFSRS